MIHFRYMDNGSADAKVHRSCGATTGPDGRVYAVGPNFVEAFDSATNAWSTLAQLSATTAYCSSAAGADGKIYIAGASAQFHMFDIAAATSTKVRGVIATN